MISRASGCARPDNQVVQTRQQSPNATAANSARAAAWRAGARVATLCTTCHRKWNAAPNACNAPWRLGAVCADPNGGGGHGGCCKRSPESAAIAQAPNIKERLSRRDQEPNVACLLAPLVRRASEHVSLGAVCHIETPSEISTAHPRAAEPHRRGQRGLPGPRGTGEDVTASSLSGPLALSGPPQTANRKVQLLATTSLV